MGIAAGQVVSWRRNSNLGEDKAEEDCGYILQEEGVFHYVYGTQEVHWGRIQGLWRRDEEEPRKVDKCLDYELSWMVCLGIWILSNEGNRCRFVSNIQVTVFVYFWKPRLNKDRLLKYKNRKKNIVYVKCVLN